MKKHWKQILILFPILLLFFLAGFFCGRNHKPEPIVSTTITAKSSAVATEAILPEVPELVDINRATLHDLTILPGIGEGLAARIVEYRNTNGPFPDCDALLNVSGIGPDTLSKILPYITAGG